MQKQKESWLGDDTHRITRAAGLLRSALLSIWESSDGSCILVGFDCSLSVWSSYFAGAEEENSYPHHPDCPPFPCGKLDEIRFPYTQRNRPECGLLVVDDCQGIIQKVQLLQGERWYQVNSISQAGTITIYDELLAKQLETKDCESLKNLSFPNLPHVTFEIFPNLTLCKCKSPLNPSFSKELSYTECKNSTIYYSQPNPQGMPEPPDNMSSLCNCPIIQLPSTNIPQDKNPLKENSQHSNRLFHMLTPSVAVRLRVSHQCIKCYSRGRQCLVKKQRFHCGKGHNLGLKLGLGRVIELDWQWMARFHHPLCPFLTPVPLSPSCIMKEDEPGLKSHSNG